MARFRLKGSLKEKTTIYLMLIPTVLLYSIFFLYPVIQGLWSGLYDWNIISPTKTFVGLDNLIYLASSGGFQTALANTLAITAVHVAASVFGGFSFAWLARKNPRVGSIFLSIALVPFILSFVTVGVMWHWIYDPRFGIINQSLNFLGLHSLTRAWTADPNTALLSIMLAENWQSMGLYAIIFSAALLAVPQSMYDAMKIDGLSELQQIRRVILPFIKDAIALSIILAVSASFKIFGLVLVLTAGGPGRLTDVMALHLYRLAFSRWQAGLACAVGIFMFVFSIAIVIIQLRVLGAKR